MLSREQAISIYREVLGRTPGDEEVDGHLSAGVDSLDQMLRLVLDSSEFEQRMRGRARRVGALQPTHVNTYHPDLADSGWPPGTRSDDGVAIVGNEGWLFLLGGSNDLLDHYTGTVEPGPDWLDRWRRLLEHRVESARALGIDLVMQMLPDKLAVYEQHFPERLERVGPRLIDRLLEAAGAPLISSLPTLRDAAAAHDVFLRTDTHLSFHGAAAVAALVIRALGAPVPADLASAPLRTYPVAGDLGIRFDPRIVGPFASPDSLGQARIVEDNYEQITAAGGHIGIRRVFANEQAPDPRVLVVFAGSFSFAAADNPGLCWFFAQVFREVHLLWFPFCWDSGYLRRVGAGAVLDMGAERFVTRVPRLDIDTAALTEEALRSGRPVGVERIAA